MIKLIAVASAKQLFKCVLPINSGPIATKKISSNVPRQCLERCLPWNYLRSCDGTKWMDFSVVAELLKATIKVDHSVSNVHL